MSVFSFSDGIWTPKLSGRPLQHPNAQFYCISNLLKISLFRIQKTPKTIKGKFISPYWKEHNCLSLTQILNKQKKLEEFSENGTEGENVHSSCDHGLIS